MNGNTTNPYNILWSTNTALILHGMQGFAVGTAADTAEKTLDSFTFNYSDLLNPGSTLRLNGFCTFTLTSGTVRVKLGSVTLFTFVNILAGNTLYFDLYVRNQDDDNIAVYGHYTTNNSFLTISTITTSYPAAAHPTIKVSGQNSIATANAITCNGFGAQLYKIGEYTQ